MYMGIGVDFGGQPGHMPPNNWETPMHLSLFITFFPNILAFPPNIFDNSTPVYMGLFGGLFPIQTPIIYQWRHAQKSWDACIYRNLERNFPQAKLTDLQKVLWNHSLCSVAVDRFPPTILPAKMMNIHQTTFHLMSSNPSMRCWGIYIAPLNGDACMHTDRHPH